MLVLVAGLIERTGGLTQSGHLVKFVHQFSIVPVRPDLTVNSKFNMNAWGLFG